VLVWFVLSDILVLFLILFQVLSDILVLLLLLFEVCWFGLCCLINWYYFYYKATHLKQYYTITALERDQVQVQQLFYYIRLCFTLILKFYENFEIFETF
jgi:hypothetical protein